tara:strand:+ start:164 stop:670 length:507 start_codon:yes stop_codon:yes gene_type:complete
MNTGLFTGGLFINLISLIVFIILFSKTVIKGIDNGFLKNKGSLKGNDLLIATNVFAVFYFLFLTAVGSGLIGESHGGDMFSTKSERNIEIINGEITKDINSTNEENSQVAGIWSWICFNSVVTICMVWLYAKITENRMNNFWGRVYTSEFFIIVIVTFCAIIITALGK